MEPTLIELVFAPALVAAATLGARRWGPRAGGVVSAFPAIVGPVLLITALEHGAAFSARAANGTLLGLVSLSGFALAYGRVAVARGTWRVSLAAGWLCAAAMALGVGAAAGGAGPPAGLLVAIVSLALAHRGLRAGELPAAAAARDSLDDARDRFGAVRDPAGAARDPAGAARDPLGAAHPIAPAPPRHDVPLRMALTALLVFSLATAAAVLGPLVGGMLAALPVLASLLAVFTHRQHGARAAALLLRGTLTGMAGFVAFVQVVAWLIVPDGIAAAFLVATLVAFAVQAVAIRPRRAGWSVRVGRAAPDPAVLAARTTR